MKYILFAVLSLISKQAICQSSDGNAVRDAVITSVPHRYQKNTFENLDSWRHPAESGFDWVRYVQRTVNLSDEFNRPLSYVDSNKTITDVLVDLLKTGKITAYSDTLDSAVMGSNLAAATISKEDSAIKGYMLLESWQFSRSLGKMKVRIVGLAPCNNKDTSFQPLVWFRYNQLRIEFKNYNVLIPLIEKRRHPKLKFNTISLNDYFENRMFSSKVAKVIPYDPSDRYFDR